MELAEKHSQFLGLSTVSPAADTPAGGLLEAKNIVHRNRGVLEPRPGFDIGALPGLADGRIEYPIDENTAGLLAIDQSAESSAGESQWDGHGSSDEVLTEKGDSLFWNVYDGTVARRSLYLLTQDALRAVHAPGAEVAYRAGVPTPVATTKAPPDAETDTTSGDIETYVGPIYRAHKLVTRRENASTGQSHIARSAPSNRLLTYFLTGSDNLWVWALLHEGEDYLPGDIIEFYSTEFLETVPEDEYFLNKERVISGDDIANGYVAFLDDTPDSALGIPLYTNVSEEGEEGANVRPPSAKAIGTFNDSLWIGNLTFPAALQININWLDGALFSTDFPDGYVGSRSFTGTLNSGSAVISGIDPAVTATLEGLMLVYRQNPDSHAGLGWLQITAVGGTTITLDEVWSGATGGAIITAVDSIRVGGAYWPADRIHEAICGAGFNMGGGTPSPGDNAYTATILSQSENTAAHTSSGRIIRMLISAILPWYQPPMIWATHGAGYSPELPSPDEAEGYTLPQDILPDHVMWSKQSEPEHFPLTNLQNAGRFGAAVMGFADVGNAMLISTDRGLWRGFGYADSGITFSELDKNVHAVSFRGMDVLGKSAYIAASDGVYRADENETKCITQNRISELDAMLKGILVEGRTSNLQVRTNPAEDEVLVSFLTSYDDLDDPFSAAYVYNENTDSWTMWEFPSAINDMSIKGPQRDLYAVIDGLEAELAAHDGTYDTDAVSTIDVISAPGLSVQLDNIANGDVDLEVGDVLYQSGIGYVITAVTNNDFVTVHKTGMSTESVVAPRLAYECRITPIVNTIKTPRLLKLWGEGAISWFRRSFLYRYGLEFRSAISGTTATLQTRTLSPTLPVDTDVRTAPAATRFLVPRNAARGTHLTLTVTVKQAMADWGIDAVTVRARTTADKAPVRLK